MRSPEQIGVYIVQFLRLMEFSERLLHGKDDKGEWPQAVQGLKQDKNVRPPTLMVDITLSSVLRCPKLLSFHGQKWFDIKCKEGT